MPDVTCFTVKISEQNNKTDIILHENLSQLHMQK